MRNEDAQNVQVSNWTLATGTRPGERQVAPIPPPARTPRSAVRRRSRHQQRTAVVIARDAAGSSWVDALPIAAAFDTIYLAAPAEASSLIGRVRPDAILVCLEFDAPLDFQLLSVFNSDPNSSGIPVIAYSIPERPEAEQASETVGTPQFQPSVDLRLMN
jgi:hypothetical protein